MILQDQQRVGLDYQPCRYGASRTLFRGPAKSLDGRYVAVLGGTEVYGRFVEQPFPDLLERRLNRTTVNFGCMNAGLDVFINDPVIMRACTQAALTVVQIVGAQNMSNRFYTVHPRRNDRFLRPARRMTEIWPDVDFSEIHFTRHLLKTLRDVFAGPLRDAASGTVRGVGRSDEEHGARYRRKGRPAVDVRSSAGGRSQPIARRLARSSLPARCLKRCARTCSTSSRSSHRIAMARRRRRG